MGDIHHQSLSIESGAFFDGRWVHAGRAANGQATERAESERIDKRSVRQIASGARETATATEDNASAPRRKLAKISKPAFLIGVPEETEWRVYALAARLGLASRKARPYLIVDVVFGCGWHR